MELQSKDYNGGERRKGTKLKLCTRDWWIMIWGVLIVVVPLFVGGIIGWTKLNDKVAIHDEALKDVTPKKIAVMQKNVETLEEDVKEIKVDIDELNTEQKAMRKDMNAGFKEVLAEIRNNR